MTDDLERLEAALPNAREDDCGNDELCMEAAISYAVSQALHKMGLRRLKSGEFFGTNQSVQAGHEERKDG